MGKFGAFAVVGHPAWGAEGGEGLGGCTPGVAGDGADESGVILGDGSERVRSPEGFGVVELALPDGVDDGLVLDGVEDVLAEDAGDEVGAYADELVLGVEVIEGGVFGVVEAVDDEEAEVFGVGVPAGCFVGFAEGDGHFAEGDASAVDGGGEVWAEAGHGGDGRDLACVGVGAAVGDAGPAGGVVVAGVVGAEAFDEAGLAGVAVLTDPGVPAGAGLVGGDEELVVAGDLVEVPGGGGDGDDHLDLAVAGVGDLDGGGYLAADSWPSGRWRAKKPMWLLRAMRRGEGAISEGAM